MAWPRLALLAAASIITLCVVLVLAHGLWERATGQDDRQSVVLFNLATSVTLGLAVLTLYAGLLVLSVVGGAALIPQSVYDGNVGHAPALADVPPPRRRPHRGQRGRALGAARRLDLARAAPFHGGCRTKSGSVRAG